MVKRNIVQSDDEQANVFQGLIDQMMEQGKIVPVAQVPGQVDMSGTTPPPTAGAGPENNDGSAGEAGGKPPKPAVPNQAPVSARIDNSQAVTMGVANQGQLIPLPPPTTSGDNGKDDIKKLLSQVLGMANSGGDDTKSEGGGSSGPQAGSGLVGGVVQGIADIVSAPFNFIGWIICTELMRQGKMPRKWWIKGAPVFAAYPDFVKQGYYLWAIPCVGHLRRSPNSLLSRVLCVVFNWRAQSIAEKATFRGTAVTAILWPICWTLGAGLWLLNKRPDWLSIYRTN